MSAMEPAVVTVTLNPAIDHTVFPDGLELGAVNRCRSHHRQAGGKGVNVSSMLGQYGVSSVATGFLGADNPRLFEELFRRDGIVDAFVRLPGETRTGIKIVEASPRRTTDLNFPGLAPHADDLGTLEETIDSLVSPGRWFVLAGSLPAGVGVAWFARLIGRIKQGGGRVAIDTSGSALSAAIDAGADLVKPNEHELGEILGRPLDDLPAQLDAARDLQRKVPHVILSLGANGALFLDADGGFHASPAPVEVVSTVGAGDSLLSGYLAGLLTGERAEHRARLATVFAWSALEDVTRRLPDGAEIRRRMKQIEVRQLSETP